MLQFLGRCHVADATLFWRGTSSLISPKKARPEPGWIALRDLLDVFFGFFLGVGFRLGLGLLGVRLLAVGLLRLGRRRRLGGGVGLRRLRERAEREYRGDERHYELLRHGDILRFWLMNDPVRI